MIIQPFTITQDQLKDIEYICPAGKDYNLHLNNGQHWELSESGKTLYLVNESPLNCIKFIVSKTIFVLKNEEEV